MNDDGRITPVARDARTTVYLVESYMPDPSAVVLAAGRSAQAAADELSSPGNMVVYRGSIAVPGDQQVFHLFEGSDARLVQNVCERAGISCDRLVEALSVGS